MKVGFVSLGCPKNLVDSEVMIGLLEGARHEITPNKEEADIIIVNTCGFIDAAKQESIDTILEMAQYKQLGNCRKLIVTGCLVERYRDELKQEIPEINALLGTNEVERILEACETPGKRSRRALPILTSSTLASAQSEDDFIEIAGAVPEREIEY